MAASLNVLTCGSVDDGKSTLIGRLLWDTDGLHADQRATLERSPKTAAGTPDFSLLVDGLAAEREQGITIDIAWRYLDTPARRLVIIDSPGHEQYTRNMATGASHADVAILLVDARGGIKEQTRRHAAILDLIGVRRVVLAVNKMDLVGWSEARFAEIGAISGKLVARFGFEDAAGDPGLGGARRQHRPALAGDALVRPALRCWTISAASPHAASAPAAEFRFPVQLVVRAGQDFRGLAGTITSGEIGVGDEVVEPVGGRRARVRRIVTMGRDLASASQGQAVVLELDTDIDVSRGAVLATPGREPPVTRSLDARLVWLSDEPFAPTRGYLLRTRHRPRSGRLDRHPRPSRPRDIWPSAPRSAAPPTTSRSHRIELGRPSAIDRYADHPETGSFMLIDPITGASVAGGVVTSTHDAGNRGTTTERVPADARSPRRAASARTCH